jgi:hypothetical protein
MASTNPLSLPVLPDKDVPPEEIGVAKGLDRPLGVPPVKVLNDPAALGPASSLAPLCEDFRMFDLSSLSHVVFEVLPSDLISEVADVDPAVGVAIATFGATLATTAFEAAAAFAAANLLVLPVLTDEDGPIAARNCTVRHGVDRLCVARVIGAWVIGASVYIVRMTE